MQRDRVAKPVVTSATHACHAKDCRVTGAVLKQNHARAANAVQRKSSPHAMCARRRNRARAMREASGRTHVGMGEACVASRATLAASVMCGREMDRCLRKDHVRAASAVHRKSSQDAKCAQRQSRGRIITAASGRTRANTGGHCVALRATLVPSAV